MKKLLLKIIDDYKKEIKPTEESNLNDFNIVENGISISREYLQKLRICLRENEFESVQEEIKFFKKQKPYVYSRLKFYAELYYFLIQWPTGSIKSQRIFIDSQIKKLQEKNQRNLDFINITESIPLFWTNSTF